MTMRARHTDLSPEDVRRELDALEQRYGLPTERRHEAFADDERCDSGDLFWWDSLARSWARSQQRATH